MKTLKRIEIIAILLFVAIIIFASFFGVYKKEDFRTVNIIKDYSLGMQFTDARVLKMTVSAAENEVIYDQEGNIVEDDGETDYSEENGYRIESVKVNKDETLTEENYKLTKKIIKNRLKGMGVGEYSLSLNKETGEINIKLQENDDVEEVLEHLTGQGKFTMIDKDTEEILLDNSDVKSAKVVYGASDEAGTSTTIYLQINFNKEGAKKLEEISKIYVAEEHVHDETEEEHEHNEETAKYVSVLLDETTLSSTYFGQTMSTGVLYIPVTEASDNVTLVEYGKEINNTATIINNGVIPIEYEFSDEIVEPVITQNILFVGILVPSVLLLIACIVLVVKFKVKGFIATFLQIGYIAALLVVLRYTNVIITVEGICGIILSIILNYSLVYAMLYNLKKKGQLEWSAIGKFALKTIPAYVIAVIFAFNSLTEISSFGMALVWGSFLLYIYNLAITRNVLKILNN